MAHVTGQCRDQATLFAERLDEVVGDDHPVRVIDAFVAGLELARLGFSKVAAEATGRPPYDPGDLLKLYVYGYLNQVRSSRRLEREAQRNVEVMWLINRLAPAFKTIADFRKDHGPAIVRVCRGFIEFCRRQALLGGEVVAIDGTKIAAVERKIADYLAALDTADREEPAETAVTMDVAAAIAALREQREKLQRQAEELAWEGLTQKVVGEPEAKLMRTPHGHEVAYNAQIAVDAEHHLIVGFDLTNEGNDQQQLHPMAVQAKEALAADAVTAVADTGYSNGEHGARCEQDGITAIVPRQETVNPKGRQYFTRDEFTYDAVTDSWRCPAGETLTCRRISYQQQNKEYWSKACGGCALKAHCTKAAKRTIVRHFYEDAREAMHRRAVSDPAWMKHRREMAEHPFGTLKWLMGRARFLVRGLIKAKAELALGVLSYNLKRAIAVLGVPALLNALQPLPA